MARAVYRAAEGIGYDPCLVCNMLDEESQLRLSRPVEAVRFDPSSNVEHMTVDGLETKGVPLVVPEVEFTHYLLNRSGWREATRDGDVFFAVGGTNQCNLPFVRQGRHFGGWTATLLWEDRVDRLQSAPLVERVRDRLSRPILEFIERKSFQAADRTVVLSEYTADRLSEKYGIDDAEVIPYPIDTDLFTSDPSGDEPGADGPVVLFVARFNDPRKNTTMLVEAFASVREAVPDAKLWLIGDDPEERILDAADRYGVDDAITYREHVPNEDLPRYYRRADAFVVPSNQEGLAIVGLEAMACGTPVVATRCGGPEQYVVDGETGYLVPRDDPAALADRVVAALDESRELGQASADLVQREYGASKIRTQFQEIIEDLARP